MSIKIEFEGKLQLFETVHKNPQPRPSEWSIDLPNG